MSLDTYNMLKALEKAGITYDDAIALRRIAMTLHRWHELQCGIGDRDTYYVDRDENDHTYMHNATTGAMWRTPDRETGALKRLDKIMAAYPSLSYYVQRDPRGAALYIIRPGDITNGPVNCNYNAGIAVYK